MDFKNRTEALRALAVEEPSPTTWDQLTALFDAWEWTEDLAIGLDYANSFLARWPDALRRVPPTWADILLGMPKALIPRTWRRGERAHPAMRLVRVLDLKGRRKLKPTELKALARGGAALEAITVLDLGSLSIGDDGALLLAACKDLHNLQSLDLSSNSLGPQGIWDLLRTGFFDGLSHLSLRYNRIGYEGVRGLATCEGLAGLTSLDLSSCDLDALAMSALADTTRLLDLRALHLGHFSWSQDAAALTHLERAPFAPGLRHLGLTGLRLDLPTARALANARLHRLDTLDLSGARADQDALDLLAAEHAFPALEHILADYVDDSVLTALQQTFGHDPVVRPRPPYRSS